jgi:glycerol uptake facilitator-like aquaporin
MLFNSRRAASLVLVVVLASVMLMTSGCALLPARKLDPQLLKQFAESNTLPAEHPVNLGVAKTLGCTCHK